MPQGVPRLNQRRYAEVVRLLKKYISNEAVNEEKRIKAIDTLLGVYDRHDRSVEKKEARKFKLDLAGQHPAVADVPPVEPQLSTVDVARRFIAGLNLGENTNA